MPTVGPRAVLMPESEVHPSLGGTAGLFFALQSNSRVLHMAALPRAALHAVSFSKWEGNVGVGSMRFQQCQLLIASRRQVRDQVLPGLARYLVVVEALDAGEAQGDPLST
jgi:hypothetical protein